MTVCKHCGGEIYEQKCSGWLRPTRWFHKKTSLPRCAEPTEAEPAEATHYRGLPLATAGYVQMDEYVGKPWTEGMAEEFKKLYLHEAKKGSRRAEFYAGSWSGWISQLRHTEFGFDTSRYRLKLDDNGELPELEEPEGEKSEKPYEIGYERGFGNAHGMPLDYWMTHKRFRGYEYVEFTERCVLPSVLWSDEDHEWSIHKINTTYRMIFPMVVWLEDA